MNASDLQRLRTSWVKKIDIRNVELGYKRASKPLMAAWARALGLTALDVHQPEPLKSSRERVA